MEILNTAESCFLVDDDLLNFTLEGENVEEEETISKGASQSSSSLQTSNAAVAAAGFSRGNLGGSFPVSFTLFVCDFMCKKKSFDRVCF